MSTKEENDLLEELFQENLKDKEYNKKLESLFEEYNIKDRAESIYQLFGEDVMDLTDYTNHFEDVITMCKALLALTKEVNHFSMTIGSRKFEFSTSGLLPEIPGIVPEAIEYAFDRALIRECSNTYEWAGMKDDKLFRIYEAHSEIVWKDFVGEEKYTDMLTDYEIRYIKRSFEKCLEYEKKAEGKKRAGYKTKNVKFGLIARKIMEKLPEDMEQKKKYEFIADFLLISGALASRKIDWIEDRVQFVKDLLKAVNNL